MSCFSPPCHSPVLSSSNIIVHFDEAHDPPQPCDESVPGTYEASRHVGASVTSNDQFTLKKHCRKMHRRQWKWKQWQFSRILLSRFLSQFTPLTRYLPDPGGSRSAGGVLQAGVRPHRAVALQEQSCGPWGRLGNGVSDLLVLSSVIFYFST